MKRRRSRRVLLLGFFVLLICSVVWFLTTEFDAPHTRGIVMVELVRQTNISEAAILRLTNTDSKSVEILGILLEEALNGEWLEKTNASIRTNMPPGGFQDLTVFHLSADRAYRARVSYWSETRGLRLVQRRIRQALKARRISVLWDSSSPQHWTEGTIDNLRP